MARPKKGQPQETNSPFKKLRLEAGLTQDDLVRLMGVTSSTIRRWEKGEAEPTMTVSQIKAFCKAVNKTLDQLPDSLLPSSKSEEDEGK
ncbi:MAG TPA: helix-turn-helix transcriptional regulator [Coleofasciculaceae cyanobacterium]|jgi:transcriptional regulator with XRE-family HTH domain